MQRKTLHDQHVKDLTSNEKKTPTSSEMSKSRGESF